MLKQIPARGFDLSSGTNLDRPAIDLSWFANRMQPSIRKLEGMEF